MANVFTENLNITNNAINAPIIALVLRAALDLANLSHQTVTFIQVGTARCLGHETSGLSVNYESMTLSEGKTEIS